MAATEALVSPRHIQNYTEAESLESHWGYLNRALPCTNDAGSCEYLDQVYGSHDLGILYSGIIWATLGGILFVWAVGRRVWRAPRANEVIPGSSTSADRSSAARLRRTIATHLRSFLLPDASRPIFGRTTRLQVLILAILAGYLLIWSFTGISYQTWITPVKKNPGLYNTRSSLGPWSDRIGILAYALTPLSVLLSTRESILSLLTGVPYQSFNFLHRWLGYIIFVQGTLHTIAWTVIEVRLYQPQPSTAETWIREYYMIWGVVAMILLLLLFVLSTPWAIRLTGYEFFRKSHYILAILYIGGCWGHWYQLQAFLIPGFALFGLDRLLRLIRAALIHYSYLSDGSMGFQTARASLTHFSDTEHGDVVRLDFNHPHDAWKVGQHFYLCFTEGSLWQSHPFTPLNVPKVQDGLVSHSYVFRAKKGETKKIADLALKRLSVSDDATTPLILTGPYGESITSTLTPDANVLCVAGGTGITSVLPVLLGLAQQAAVKDRKIQLVWAIRHKQDMRWIQQELNALHHAEKSHNIEVHIFVTRETGSKDSLLGDDEKIEKDDMMRVRETRESSCCSSTTRAARSSASIDVQKIGGGVDRHPNLNNILRDFVEANVRGPTRVFASGPGGMISDLRSIVASCNSASKVWSGNERFDVRLTCDDRLEW